MSITDELREWGKRFDRAWFNGEGIITFSTFRPTAGDVSIREIVESIADRIDAEHKAKADEAYENGKRDERAEWLDETDGGYIKLPVDADGVPIRVGDELMFRDYRTPARASYVGLTCEGWVIEDDNLGHEHKPYDCRHVQPDSWQRIIEDALHLQHGVHTLEYMQLVERCRRLAGEA